MAGALSGILMLSVAATSGAQALSGTALLRAHDAAASCNAYYQDGVTADEAASSAPIVMKLTASYATTPAGMEEWVQSMPNGPASPPSAIRSLASSALISVCYLTDTAGPISGSSSAQGSLQTEIVAIEPDGTPVTVAIGPLTLPFGPPPSS